LANREEYYCLVGHENLRGEVAHSVQRVGMYCIRPDDQHKTVGQASSLSINKSVSREKNNNV